MKMKKTLTLVMMVLFTLSLLTACSGNGGSGNGGSGNDEDVAPTDTPGSPPPTESAAPATGGGDIEEINADDWFISHWWGLRADFSQQVAYGDFSGSQSLGMNLDGMYADISFKILMEHDNAFENDPSIDGEYWFLMDSTIVIDTDEAADRMLSEKLGFDLSGMGLGISGELSGSYRSFYSYTDSDGNYTRPEFDQNGDYIVPDEQNDNPRTSCIQRVAGNWRSPIKDKSGKTVQPAAGSYMLFETIKMEYTGSTSHALVGSFAEAEVYDLYIYILIAPDATGASINVNDLNERDAKVYIDLHTVNGNHIWIEGNGFLFLNEAFYPRDKD